MVRDLPETRDRRGIETRGEKKAKLHRGSNTAKRPSEYGLSVHKDSIC